MRGKGSSPCISLSLRRYVMLMTVSAAITLHWWNPWGQLESAGMQTYSNRCLATEMCTGWGDVSRGWETLRGERAANCLALFLFCRSEWAEAFKETNKAVCARTERNLSVTPAKPNICSARKLIIANLLTIHGQLLLSDFHFSPDSATPSLKRGPRTHNC